MSDMGRRGRWSVGIIALSMAVVIIFALLLARQAMTSFSPAAESPGGPAQLGAAPPVATPTPIGQASGQTNAGSVLGAATPLATAIVPGYPRPDQDNAQEQALRAQIGNPAKVIMVSLTGQYIQAFQNGKLVQWSYVTTGKADTPTPTGFFTVMEKRSPYTFSTSAPPGSPEYYYPTKGIYALLFADGGYFLHDAWWRTVYGPGLTSWHYDPGRQEYQTGSHGCVNTPLAMIAWLFVWADVGTNVIVF